MAVQKRVLLVEGINDKHVINNLLRIHNISGLDIRDKGGISNILETLKTEVDANQDFLGIVVDANSRLDSRWQSLRDRLRNAEIGYGEDIPDKPVERGLIVEGRDFLPKLGIWVMPNNQLLGNIENFVRLLVAEDKETLWRLSEKVVEEIPAEERLFADKDIIKATMHTFLAWQDEPGRPMGESITRRYFRPDAREALNFVDWARRLYF